MRVHGCMDELGGRRITSVRQYRQPMFSAIGQEKIRESFSKHRANSDVSADEYVRARHIALGESVAGHERVYLDTRYWIILRDAVVGRSNDERAKQLLEALRWSVHNKRQICPISDTVFLELLKQSDLGTRRETARMIDELSGGVTLIPQFDRVATEIAHFLYSQTERDLYPLDRLVWSRLSYVLGIQHPTNPIFGTAEQCVVQKAFVDHMWDLSLTEMMDVIASGSPPEMDYQALARKLNHGAAAHVRFIESFAQTYDAEIRGSLSVFMSHARQVVERVVAEASKVSVPLPGDEPLAYEAQLLDFFCDKVRRKEVALALRTSHIGALCHAAVRWDKRRQLTGNDIHDFHHAAAAVGYCDVFLTEKPLKTLLEQGHMQLTKDFSCRIISSLDEAVAWATA